MTLLAKIVRRGPADWLMAAEALVLLTLFRACLAMVPVRRIVRAITHGREGATAEGKRAVPIPARDLQVARRVQWAVSAVTRHSVVEFVCFPQTLAAFLMLRRRGVPSTIVYGVGRSAEGTLIAHTWLEAGDRIVTGGEASAGFAAIERWK